MNEMYIARGVITSKASHIEALLRELGAQGTGFKELTDSISDQLDSDDSKFLRHVVTLRNRAAHESEFAITEQELLGFLTLADDLIYVFSKRSGVPNAAYLLADQRQDSKDAMDAFKALAAAAAVQSVQPAEPQVKSGPRLSDVDSGQRLLRQGEVSVLSTGAKSTITATSLLSEGAKSKIKKGLKAGLITIAAAVIADL